MWLLAVNEAACNILLQQRAIAFVFQIWKVPAGYEELVGGLEPVKNSKIFWVSNKGNIPLPMIIYYLCASNKKSHYKTQNANVMKGT